MVKVVDEMVAYESHAQAPFMHTWYDDIENVERIYMPAPSFGADTNTTMNFSGLILFTDANFTQVNFYRTFNSIN
ncbi:unnamed protein product [Protopolystoma xenopodis]|uniref:Uncharacterized protein n=1 Tax=Protopolystoma xenopodis TaxID=117903 RepID=A0A3S5BPQ2_9PLAT|nr:unnamed protein product [Protopolystoma xenopodis]